MLSTCCGPVQIVLALLTLTACAAQGTAPPSGPQPPYDARPDVAPPYYGVRYDASRAPGELIFPVTYTAWIPPDAPRLRGVIVHQHGCGEGSCKSGLTGAFDLHWQALAHKHSCALVAPSYEQPEKADCQMWCDPRNGSATAFERALADLGRAAGRPELATVPWVLWGHSGGGHWAGGMALVHPERVVAAWLAPIEGGTAVPAEDHAGDPLTAGWLPNEALARAWMQYVKDSAVGDDSPPPAPTNLRITGTKLTWTATADLESGLAGFVIERDGMRLTASPVAGKNPFGRAVFQGLQYSDTPVYPLVRHEFLDTTAEPGRRHRYHIFAVNTLGRESDPSKPVEAK